MYQTGPLFTRKKSIMTKTSIMMRMSTKAKKNITMTNTRKRVVLSTIQILPPQKADSAYHGPETGATSVSLIVIANVFTAFLFLETTMVDTAVMMLTTMITVMNMARIMMKTNTRTRKSIMTRMNTRKKATAGTAKMKEFSLPPTSVS